MLNIISIYVIMSVSSTFNMQNVKIIHLCQLCMPKIEESTLREPYIATYEFDINCMIEEG